MQAKVITTTLEIVPIEHLKQHPKNYRIGNIDAITESIRVNGFYGHIYAQKSTRYILAGHHRLEAAKQAGLHELPVCWLDVDDETASRILLADNRTSDLANNDRDLLVEILAGLQETDLGLLGTCYSEEDLGILSSVGEEESLKGEADDSFLEQNRFSYTVIFDDKHQLDNFKSFIKYIDSRYSDIASKPERLNTFLEASGFLTDSEDD